MSQYCDTLASSRTGSTVWGPGALTGKALKVVGETGLDVVMNIVIRRRLAAIKQALNDTPELFVYARDSEQVRLIEFDLEELHRPCYLKTVRNVAKILQRDVRAYRRVAIIQETLEATPGIMLNPQGHEEQERIGHAYEDLAELALCQGSYYSADIAKIATHTVSSIVQRCSTHDENLSLLLDLHEIDRYAFGTGALDTHGRPLPPWEIRWRILLHCIQRQGSVIVTQTTVTQCSPSLSAPQAGYEQRLVEIFGKYEDDL